MATNRMQHLPKVTIDIIPHKKQRYDTCGDYFRAKGTVNIRISKLNADHEFLVALHEFVEWFLVERKGVTIEDIDKFDIAYENNRKEGDTSEPGDDPNAPYFNEHQIATDIEKQLAKNMGVNWQKYDEHVNSL